MHRIHRLVLALTVILGLSLPAAAQNSITQSDIQRLQDNASQATRSVQQLRGRDESRARQLQAELDDLQDEVIYLKVKLRKENTLSRGEYADVRDRIDDVRTRANDEYARLTAPPPPPAPAPAPAPVTTARGTQNGRGAVEVPVGTEIDVRLQSNLNSGTAMVEDRFEGTTLADVIIDGRTAIPAGAVMRGVVTSVEPAGRLNRTARLTVSFDQVTINGRAYPMRGTVTQALEGEGIKGDATKIGAGAGVGAIIGGILGGVKGALAGILIGGGGTIAATEGKQVDLPQGAVLRVRIDSPLQVGPGAR
jgi:hypothetical protein